MISDKLNVEAGCAATMVMNHGVADALFAHGVYYVECYDKDGNLKWREEARNTVVTAGRNDILDQYLAGSAYTASFLIGLKGSGTVAAADTIASHAGWSEITAYSGNRGAPSWSAASAGSKSTSSAIAFSINGSATVAGCFLIRGGSTTPGNTASGTLISAGDFSASRSVVNGDTLNVSYSLTV